MDKKIVKEAVGNLNFLDHFFLRTDELFILI